MKPAAMSATAEVLAEELKRGTWSTVEPPRRAFKRYPNDDFKYADCGNIAYPWDRQMVSANLEDNESVKV